MLNSLLFTWFCSCRSCCSRLNRFRAFLLSSASPKVIVLLTLLQVLNAARGLHLLPPLFHVKYIAYSNYSSFLTVTRSLFDSNHSAIFVFSHYLLAAIRLFPFSWYTVWCTFEWTPRRTIFGCPSTNLNRNILLAASEAQTYFPSIALLTSSCVVVLFWSRIVTLPLPVQMYLKVYFISPNLDTDSCTLMWHKNFSLGVRLYETIHRLSISCCIYRFSTLNVCLFIYPPCSRLLREVET